MFRVRIVAPLVPVILARSVVSLLLQLFSSSSYCSSSYDVSSCIASSSYSSGSSFSSSSSASSTLIFILIASSHLFAQRRWDSG